MDNLAILKIDPFFTQDYCTRAIGTTVNCYEGVNLPTVFTKGMNRDPKYESKLYSFPYMYWMLTDYQCDPMIIKPEWLDSEDMQVMCTQSLSHQPKTKYFLGTGYMGEDNGKSNCIINSTVNDLPLTSSAYVNYIIANKAQATAGMALAVGNSALNIAVGAMTGGLGLAMTAGNMLNGFSAIAQEMAKRKDLQNIPDSVKHSGNNVSFDITDDNIHVKLIRYEIHPDFKKRLADFWAMYGYKSGEVKVPNISTRYYYNYVKTIGCVIDGDMDTEAKSKIRSIFDMGVTLWHYHAGENFSPLDYTYENIETTLL
jgi:hypothetical protein